MDGIQDCPEQEECKGIAKGESGEEDLLHDWYLEQGLDELTSSTAEAWKLTESKPPAMKNLWMRIRGFPKDCSVFQEN